MKPFSLVVLDCFTGDVRRYSCIGRVFNKEADGSFGKGWREARRDEADTAQVIQKFRRGEI